MTNTEYLRQRIYERSGLTSDGKVPKRGHIPSLEVLKKTEWSPVFEQACRYRLIMGGIRYGRLHAPGKKQYDRIIAALKRLQEYQITGNDELLIDVSNFCMLEFEEGNHPLKHFNPVDDGQHVKESEK